MARNDAYTMMGAPRLVTDKIPGTVPNHDGGAVYELDDLAIARRFLIIGSAGGTFYQGERDITRENADVLRALAASRPAELVELIADVSERGLAPKADPQLFALAICTATAGEARAAAYREFGRIIRTGSHLLMWARYHKALGGGISRSWRRAVSDWYTGRDEDSLAYQMAKYRSRDGWSQRDLIDMSHALAGGETRDMRHGRVLRWARGETLIVNGSLPPLIRALEESNDAAKLIDAGASWEMLPDAALKDARTWELLVARRRLPMGAMLRQLGRMTQLGVFDEYFTNETASAVKAFFDSEESLRRARLHPLNIMLALRQYGEGSRRSGGTYRPNMGVAAMLSQAFYKAFETAPASGKRTLVGVDVSPSMNYPTSVGLKSTEIAMIMGMKIVVSEPASSLVGFSGGVTDLGIHKLTTIENAMQIAERAGRNWSNTNPSALIQFAAQNKIPVDTFVVITDNEVNHGQYVPDALRAYRKLTGIPAKLAVVATTATRFTIADPADQGMLDIAGFGADVPALLTEFSRGL